MIGRQILIFVLFYHYLFFFNHYFYFLQDGRASPAILKSPDRTSLLQSVLSPHPLADSLLSSWSGKLAASLCSFIMSCPPSCMLHAAGHCISLRTFNKSPRPGLLPLRDLGFLPAQHMLHTYRLSVLLPCHFCTPWMVPECLFHKEPVVSRTVDECEPRERLKEYWHRTQKNLSMWHVFGH